MAKVLKIGCAKQKLEKNPQKSFEIMSEKILKGVFDWKNKVDDGKLSPQLNVSTVAI